MFALGVDTAVQSAIVVGVFVIINRLLDRSNKREDWRRQDAVAAEAKIQAAAIVAANQESTVAVTHLAVLTEGNAAEIATIKVNGEKAVHLADGAFTSAKKSERWALAAKLASDRTLIAYKTGTGQPPSDVELAAVEQGEAMVEALNVEIAAREAAIVLATTEAENGKNHTPPKGSPVLSP